MTDDLGKLITHNNNLITSVRSDIEVREDLFCIPVISEHMAIKKTDFVKDVNEIPNNCLILSLTSHGRVPSSHNPSIYNITTGSI